MFKVDKKYQDLRVSCGKFTVILKDATQEQLEYLYHLGHKGIEATKKVKNKQLDNNEGAPVPEVPKIED
jgi:hypothetical protein